MADQVGPSTPKTQRTSYSLFSHAIPDDLLTDILTRLPDRRHVTRCAAVCTRWLSLVSNAEFAGVFERRRGASAPALLLQSQGYEPHRVEEDKPEFFRWIQKADGQEISEPGEARLSFLPWKDFAVRASFDDLLLISRIHTGQYYNPKSKMKFLWFCICNPVARTWHALPTLSPIGIKRILRCALWRDGAGHYGAAVFCEMRRFRCALRNMEDIERVRVTVLSPGTWYWSRPIALPPPRTADNWLTTGIDTCTFHNTAATGGRLYWVEGDNVVSINPSGFAAGGLRCRFMSLPEGGDSGPRASLIRPAIGVCGGRLRLADMAEWEGGWVLRVWEYCSSWTNVYSAVLEGVDVKRREAETRIDRVLALHPSNLDLVFVLCDDSYVFEYDMVRRRGQMIGRYMGTRSLSVHVLCVHSLWPSKLPCRK